jgi:glucose/mannose-6-phosphate isomerase
VLSFVVDGPLVPSFVDQDTFAFVLSYSGNTWETVIALKELISRGIKICVITHGGKALQLAQQHKLTFFITPESIAPRAALGNFLGILLGIFEAMNILQGHELVDLFIKHAQDVLSLFQDQEYFKDFLALAQGYDFFHVWGVSGDASACAYRAQTQFNENSKVQAVYSAFPELCHNLIVGFTQATISPLVLLFVTDYLSANLQKAVRATEELLIAKKTRLYKPPVLGNTFQSQMFNMILWADFASYFLGVARGVDVGPVVLIDQLKEMHKRKGILI